MMSRISLQNLLQEFLDAVEVVVRNGVRLKVHNHFLGVKKPRTVTKQFMT